jgi:hypothetical protein
VVVRAPDLGGCLGVDCLGSGLLRNGRVSQEPHLLCVSTQTHLVHRTWLERLKLWRHAYETKISGGRHEAVGRGPTPRESQEAAERRWVAEQSAEKERGE